MKKAYFNGFMVWYITFGCTIFFGSFFNQTFRWSVVSRMILRDRCWRKGLQFICLRQALLQVLVDLAIELLVLMSLYFSSVIRTRF